MSGGPEGPASLPDRIVLTGFMGAGKSTVGRLLAARLRWPFFDIDGIITAQEQLSVAEIFARHGEAHFRELEVRAVAAILQREKAVIALGGGAIETDSVRQQLFATAPSASATVTIYLEAPLVELLGRCHHAQEVKQEFSEGSSSGLPLRPLLAAGEPVEERLKRRLPYYRRAHLTVDTAGVPPGVVVDRIVAALPTAALPTAAPSTRQSI